jgi:hypothetical protein
VDKKVNQGAIGRRRADYGIDAPGIVRNFALSGVAAMVAGGVLDRLLARSHPTASRILRTLCVGSGLSLAGMAGFMIWGSKIGKVRGRHRLLALIPWRGNELVLDVGCGHGLLLIGAAQRLTTGKAIGIDLWRPEDQLGNTLWVVLGGAYDAR